MPQFMHALPPEPHAKPWSPPRHWLPWQQPVAHVTMSQTGVTHAPLRHCWPFMQRVHMAPLPPQPMFVCCDGVTQKPIAQQPVHAPGPHAAITHCPLTHCSPVAQRLQMPLVLPHASGESPGTQRPMVVQPQLPPSARMLPPPAPLVPPPVPLVVPPPVPEVVPPPVPVVVPPPVPEAPPPVPPPESGLPSGTTLRQAQSARTGEGSKVHTSRRLTAISWLAPRTYGLCR